VRRSSSWRLTLLLVGLPCVLYGYIDPGSGSFLIQSLLAGLLGLSFTFKTFWRTLKGRLARNAKTEQERP
jgi:hypothetical protein